VSPVADRPRRIFTIVEGHGEVEALPVLLWRLQARYAPEAWIDVGRPFRVGRDTLLAEQGVENALDTALPRGPAPDGLLILLDSDDDCPVTLANGLRDRIEAARPGLSHAVVFAHREFEAWFLAAAESLRGCQGLDAAITAPAAPESIRGCKEWLSRYRPPGDPYKPKADQAGLAAAFDLDMARAGAPSFDKFCRDITYLITGKRGN